MRCAPGICVHCEASIANPCSDCGTYKPNEKYTTIQMPWSNGSKMTMPVCVECSRGPVWNCDKQALTKAVWDAWDKEGARYDRGVTIV